MNEDRGRLVSSMIWPAVIVLAMWLVKIIEVAVPVELARYGLIPLDSRGLAGIITAPLLHEGFSHLAGNSIPVFILGSLLFYSYRELAWKVLVLVWLMTGAWVWVFARGPGVHIGASGVVNGLAAFLFLSGVLRKETKLMAITLLTVFLYGSVIWGIFPQLFPQKNISWESHLMGLLSGSILALYFRNDGPQRIRFDWEDEEEGPEEDLPENEQGVANPGEPPAAPHEPEIRYHYRENPPASQP